MTRQFLRVARLRVGATGTLEKEYNGFRITFKLEKNLESAPNTGSISIYNLNDDSRNRLDAKDAICSLDVGYGETLEQLFIGNIAKAFTRKIGVDTITEIEIGDGEKAFQDAHIDLSFPPGTTAKQVLEKVTESFKNVTSGGVKSVKAFLLTQFKSFGTGLVLSGSSKDILDNLTKTCGLEWSIQDGELQILEKDTASQETALELSASTGLVGSPGKIKAATDKSVPNGGIEFTCLLQPKLKPGRLVKISSYAINGLYKITKVSHEGDNFGGTWLSKCEAYLNK